MCYIEYETKSFICKATTGDVNVLGGEGIPTASSSVHRICPPHANAGKAYLLYVESHDPAAGPLLNRADWCEHNGLRFCHNPSTYWATWTTTRECITLRKNGEGSCQQKGKPHKYRNAPGLAAV
ncbi:hypothetical protein K443DRAFT_680554 [Laccaria amethystina LaAM-08-1]|uniref:Uncharacterized protein n=1 Tax=Laccaria amethystina LaAM-08-1 TaxID=1095629 RepID=A0A0C9XRZ9_9AGAR|nr:hypothetical protein K443DRAFT_680554 [Laccaria amethystina LaAM-08-1]